jgi:uncharacterized membrane protein YfcA
MTVLLGFSFFVTALIYASVGFGGGSTYSALLALANTDLAIFPLVSLTCNIIVVFGGTFAFSKWHPSCFRMVIPWAISSVPAALIGGQIDISKNSFPFLLALSLLISSVCMLRIPQKPLLNSCNKKWGPSPLKLSIPVGFCLGLLSGVVGIGGGVFLSPLLYALGKNQEKEIAGMCSIFILLNSTAGLIGHFIKAENAENTAHSLLAYGPLFLSVLIGGQIGAWSSARLIDPKWIRVTTAVLILYVSAQLFLRWATTIGL